MESAGFPLKDYQKEGLEWMVNHETRRSSGYLITDDPGLGKTIQIASIMLHNPGTTLLIVPNSIVVQWERTLKTINPSWVIYKHMGQSRCDNRLDLYNKKYDICITTLGTLIAEADKESMTTLLHTITKLRPWHRIVIDEAHNVRNSKSISYEIVNNIRAKFYVGLTGTPIQNKRQDLTNLLKFIGVTGDEIRLNCEHVVKTYVLRRNKSLLYGDNTNFAPYVCENIYVPFASVDEQELYRAIQSELVSEFLKKSRMANDRRIQMMVLEMILRLRQATAHPVIAAEAITAKYGVEFDDIDINGITPGKFQKIMELIDSAPSDDKFIIFCQFSQEIHILKDYLETAGELEVGIYNGELSMAQKDKMVQRSPRVLIIQTRCGGVGLNLQQYNRVIIMSPDWNPANEIQAIARAHRLGQQKQVYVYRLLAVANTELEDPDQYTIDPETKQKVSQLSTIDERILHIQIKKKMIMIDVMQDDTYMDHADKRVVEFAKVDFKNLKLSISELKQAAGLVKRIRPKLSFDAVKKLAALPMVVPEPEEEEKKEETKVQVHIPGEN